MSNELESSYPVERRLASVEHWSCLNLPCDESLPEPSIMAINTETFGRVLDAHTPDELNKDAVASFLSAG